MLHLAAVILLYSCFISPTLTSAWTLSKSSHGPPPETHCHHRRSVLQSLLITTPSLILPIHSASAITTQQQEIDKRNLLSGYQRLSYLLDHWESETTVCKTGQETTFGDTCTRTPLKVQEYLGYKSTTDPLFKADSTMLRLKSLVSPQDEEEYYNAIDTYVQNAEEANGMAFVSSWGEANPGGGKDRVELFIERSKKNVMESRDGLKRVLDILGLKP